MGTAEIAVLGVSRQRLLKLAEQSQANGFPAPIATLIMGEVWDGPQVRAWPADYTPRGRSR